MNNPEMNSPAMLEDPIGVDQLPSPKGVPVLGHLLQFNVDNLHQVLERWVEESGEVFRISLLGKKFIVSANGEINDQIFKARPDKFRRMSKIEEIVNEMGIVSVVDTEGEIWKRHRKVASEALSPKNVKGFFPTVVATTKKLLSKWDAAAKNCEKIDVLEDVSRFTVDITTVIAFGYPMNTLEKGDDVIQKHLSKVFPMIHYRVLAPFPIWRIFKSKKHREFDHAMGELKKTIYQMIDKTKQYLEENPHAKESPENFLEALLVQQELEGNFTDKEVFGNVFNMLLAGEDTTSSVISWTLYFLAQRPDVVLKVREEAERVYGSQACAAEYEEMIQLKYADAVAQESMRVKQVSPSIWLEALEDIAIEGYLFQKGATVMLQNKVPQTDPRNFINPDDFIPERWLRDECPMEGAHTPKVMKAFGGGPRFCPGRGLAMHEIVTSISMICKNFNLELAVKPGEVREVFSAIMAPNNLWIRLRRPQPETNISK